MTRALLRSLRIPQWSKNVFVLAPLVFARQLGEPQAIARALLAFAAFCAAASAIYLLNDIRDREDDRRHPSKSRRPIASGALGVFPASLAAVALALAAAALAARLGASFAGFLGAYALLNLLYTLRFKTVVILDVMSIAMGFVLRVAAGGAALAVAVSNWLLLCTTFLALFLAFSKRRHELLLLADRASDQRRVLSDYSPAFLDQMINVVTASSVVCYALYAAAPETVAKFGTDKLIWTVPLVVFGIFRYLYLTYQRNEARNPTEAILTDLPSVLNVIAWVAAVLWIIYRPAFPIDL